MFKNLALAVAALALSACVVVPAGDDRDKPKSQDRGSQVREGGGDHRYTEQRFEPNQCPVDPEELETSQA